MAQDPGYHTQRTSMMMGQSAGYGHLATNHPYASPQYSRGYPRASMHPSPGMGGVIAKQVSMGLQQGVSHGYMTGSSSVMPNAGYLGGNYVQQHPHQLSQTPQALQSMGGIAMGQGYHGVHQAMGQVSSNNTYMRNSMYQSNQGLGINQQMGYPSHPHHRVPMPPSLSHLAPRPAIDPLRMPMGSHLQHIKSETPQHMVPSSMLPPSVGSINMGTPLDTHQPTSNPPIYQQYASLPPTPIPVPDDSDFKKAREIATVFETYRSQAKDDSELVRKISSYIPILRSKTEGIQDIIQECEQLCKQLQSADLSITEQTAILNTNSLNYFSDNKFPDNRLPPEFTLDIPVNRTEHFLSFEIARLDPRIFSVERVQTSNGTCFNLSLKCHLKREGLPMVPPLLLRIPADYPSSSPEADLPDKYSETPFLRQVRKCLTEDMVSLAGEYTLSHILNCWERVVKNICVTM